MCNLDARHRRHAHAHIHRRGRQRGLSLLELLVGLAIGLLVVAAAIGTLILSRSTSGTISEISQLQQQAAHAMRILGLQVRQAGALEPVAKAGSPGTVTFLDFAPDFTVIAGTDGGGSAGDSLTVGTQSPTEPALRRDCLGASIPGEQAAFANVFAMNANRELTCKSVSSNVTQPIVGNVADFQVRYRVNVGTTSPVETASFRSFTASDMGVQHWDRVRAIEVCLDMVGTEAIPDGGIPYVDCHGASVARNGRIHLVFRNVFSVRRQNEQQVPL